MRWTKPDCAQLKWGSADGLLYLHRDHNKIRNIDGKVLKDFTSLETLDLNNNDISEIQSHSFPAGLQIKYL